MIRKLKHSQHTNGFFPIYLQINEFILPSRFPCEDLQADFEDYLTCSFALWAENC